MPTKQRRTQLNRRRPRRIARPPRRVAPGGWPSRVVERPTPEDLLDLTRSVTALATQLRYDLRSLKSWEASDLAQEVLLKAMLKLDQFRGGSSLKTWVVSVGRNHLLSMARAAAIRPSPLPDATRPVVDDPGHRMTLRLSTKDLLAWLRQNPEEVEHGWEVFNLLLWSHGNYDRVATAMCLHTGTSWTTERVRNVARAIRKTPRGRSLCEAIGLTDPQKENDDG